MPGAATMALTAMLSALTAMLSALPPMLSAMQAKGSLRSRAGTRDVGTGCIKANRKLQPTKRSSENKP
eukprot:2778810-Prymnesium_polylepis.1